MKNLIAAFALSATTAQAAVWNNEDGHYSLPPLPAAAAEAARLDTDEREDQHPLGRMVRAGDEIKVTLQTLPPGIEAALVIGFRPLWDGANDQQIDLLGPGLTSLTARQDGPVFLRLTGTGDAVRVGFEGGKALPLYVDGAMTAADWRAELRAHAGAEFVQLVGDHAMITLTADAYRRDPIADPAASFAMINAVLTLEDDLSGLDGATPPDPPTPLRLHFIVDFRASAADRQNFYMYATDGFIGMLPDNTGDLTNPDRLSREWAIWHEVGHIHQQNSWNWGSATEITVKIWSLFVQESLGNPNRLREPKDGGKSTLAVARDYIGAGDGPPDYLGDDGNTLFIRLVMFQQLRDAYGWDLFRNLNRATRANPLPAGASDQEKVDYFVRTICDLTGHDLRGFFQRWGLMATDTVLAQIGTLGLPLPPADPARPK